MNIKNIIHRLRCSVAKACFIAGCHRLTCLIQPALTGGLNPEFFGIAIGGITAVTADDTANLIDLATGATPASRLVCVTLTRAGVITSMAGAVITLNQGGAGIVRIADGGSFAVTAADVYTVMVTEKPLA